MVSKSDRDNFAAIARCLKAIIAGEAPKARAHDVMSACLRVGLIAQGADNVLVLTDAGQAWLSRHEHRLAGDSPVSDFRAQHLELSRAPIMRDGQLEDVIVNDGESPLAWLARRKGRDGRAMIDPTQFTAGERLRADFTRGQMMPRVTSSWSAPTGRTAVGGAGEMTDLIVASRQRVSLALDGVGPEFSGILMDICCFLRGLEDVERERGWPARSAKVVLQLALNRLARHYGLVSEVRGAPSSPGRVWSDRAPASTD